MIHKSSQPGLVVIFGSGEMSPTGRKIHEEVFRRANLKPPVKIGILETPTGFEVNAIHGWPERMQKFFEKSLVNFKPGVSRIRAWRKTGDQSTNDPKIVDALLDLDYLYCGAGSPGYTITHLKDSRAYANFIKAHQQGTILSIGSATAVALSWKALPVYEIFKTGRDLFWMEGLNFFSLYDLELVFIPHWNNQEGEDFDTTRCYMGKERFGKLVAMLPASAVILGIDEQTACLFDVTKRTVEVLGIGQAHILKAKSQNDFPAGSTFSFNNLT